MFWILSLLEPLVFYAFGGFADNLSVYLFAEFLFSGALLIYFLATNRHRFFEDYLCTIALLLSIVISFVEVGLSMFYGETADIAPLKRGLHDHGSGFATRFLRMGVHDCLLRIVLTKQETDKKEGII